MILRVGTSWEVPDVPSIGVRLAVEAEIDRLIARYRLALDEAAAAENPEARTVANAERLAAMERLQQFVRLIKAEWGYSLRSMAEVEAAYGRLLERLGGTGHAR